MPKVTFSPRRRKRYLVLKDGEPMRRHGKPLFVRQAGIAALRSQIENAGRLPPPPLVPFKRPGPESKSVVGDYDSSLRETWFSCPWCFFTSWRDGHFTGPTYCVSCNKPFTIVPTQAEPVPVDDTEEVESIAWGNWP